MNVQQLIDQLQAIEDKTMPVYHTDESTDHSFEITSLCEYPLQTDWCSLDYTMVLMLD